MSNIYILKTCLFWKPVVPDPYIYIYTLTHTLTFCAGTEDEEDGTNLSDSQLQICNDRVLGYCLKDKDWSESMRLNGQPALSPVPPPLNTVFSC